MDYAHKVTPFEHQAELFARTRDEKIFGVLWEQGCAKTKPIIDTAAWNWRKRRIDGALIVAPNGVHLNWRTDEIPAHLPDDVMAASSFEVFSTAKSKNKSYKAVMDNVVKTQDFSWLFMSYDGFMTEVGKKLAWRFLQRRRVLYTLDESDDIKSPGAKRTRSIVASGAYAEMRRIMTGTMVTAGPFDVYAQIKFLDEDFWKRRGLADYAAFKTFFGVWFTREQASRSRKDGGLGYDPGYDKLVEYRNLELLNEWISEITDRKLKEDVLDLPPKVYSKRYYEMSKEQRRVYDTLRDQFIVELESGRKITADLAIVRLLRLQQVTCGYLPTDDGEEPFEFIGKEKPRLDCTVEACEHVGHQAIVWARFTKDIDQICDALGDRAVRYDGRLNDEECARSKEAFQKGEKQFFVANQQKASRGLTLVQAKTAIYHSNSYKLRDRLQSEDRAHRPGQTSSLGIVDVVCPGTTDEKVIANLKNKFEVAAIVNGDKLREWL